jgi:hypothetical protein
MVESHPFDFAQGRLLRKRPRKDGAPAAHLSQISSVTVSSNEAQHILI